MNGGKGVFHMWWVLQTRMCQLGFLAFQFDQMFSSGMPQKYNRNVCEAMLSKNRLWIGSLFLVQIGIYKNFLQNFAPSQLLCNHLVELKRGTLFEQRNTGSLSYTLSVYLSTIVSTLISIGTPVRVWPDSLSNVVHASFFDSLNLAIVETKCLGPIIDHFGGFWVKRVSNSIHFW